MVVGKGIYLSTQERRRERLKGCRAVATRGLEERGQEIGTEEEGRRLEDNNGKVSYLGLQPTYLGPYYHFRKDDRGIE